MSNFFEKTNSEIQTEDIKHRIEASLKRSAINNSQKIHVSTDGGRVILSGRCQSRSEMNDAVSAAWMAPGVTDVANNLQFNTKAELNHGQA